MSFKGTLCDDVHFKFQDRSVDSHSSLIGVQRAHKVCEIEILFNLALNFLTIGHTPIVLLFR